MADITNQLATLIDGLNLSDEQIEQLTRNLATAKTNALLALDEQTAAASLGTRITKRGFDIIAKGNAGKQIKYTKVSLGDSMHDGELPEVTPEEGVLLDDLVNRRLDLSLTDIKFTGGGTCTLKFALTNAEIPEGFFIRELGVFAEDPDTKEEVLYCYRNSGLLSDFIPAGSGSVLWNLIISIVTVVDAATNVTAVIDGNLAFVTQTELTDHINSENPHPNLARRGEDISTTAYVWATDNDFDLHRISIENLQNLILGGAANTFPKLERRISQVEINLANLALQLKAETELGFRPNLMLVEDFADLEFCDMYSCNVISQVAGIDAFQISSDKNILCGHWYTITDGIRSEYVRIKSVAKNADNVIVVFEDELKNTYNLENTIMLRSTTLMRNGAAEGSGDLRGTTIKFTDVWQGSGGNVATSIPLETTQSQAANFIIGDDGAFTSNGEFTIS